MSNDQYELRSMASIALDVQFIWTLGLLAKFLKVFKKDLRLARRIIENPKLEELVPVGKQEQLQTFYFGYNGFYKVIKKKKRHILAPHPHLQMIFRAINEKIIELCPAHEKAYGFVKKRNFQMAATSLIGNKHFFSFDITDAFPSITDVMIEKILFDLEVPEYLVKPLANLVTYQYQGLRRLPQGAASSPPVLNMVYKPMCEEIEAFCQKQKINWCVYADDFTFASEVITAKEQQLLLAIPEKYGFVIKPEKTKDNFGNTIPRMLGLSIVDDRIHLKRYTKLKFSRMLFAAWKHDAYNDRQVDGIAAVIKQTYGEVQNWPGSLRKYWVLCINKRQEKKRRHHEKRK